MSRTTLIVGPPGTGKTHYLLSKVAEAMDAKIPPERIGFFTFTRRAAQEAITRAMEQFGVTRDRFPHFRTLHSAAYHLIGIKRHEVMRRKHFSQLGEALGLEFSASIDEETQRMPYAGKLGDKMLSLYTLARARNLTIAQQWYMGTYYDFPLRAAEEFAENLETFKRYHGLLDFSDFLDRCHHTLDLDLFILDEAQDLTRQEWALARRLAAKTDKVLIAGDDDQAIYGWAGADVERIIHLDGQHHTLPVSYRLPRAIFDVANGVSSKISLRLPKIWQPNREGGEVIRLPNGGQDGVDLRTGEWLLLARHRSQLGHLEKLVRQQGRTYLREDFDITRADTMRGVLNYEALRSGKTIKGALLRQLAMFIADFSPEIEDDKFYAYEDIPWPWDDRRDWMTALSRLSTEDVAYLRSLRRNDESLTAQPKVRITTIHGSKGAEADNVLLLTWANNRVREQAKIFPDEERRVWYVGVSRARNRLVTAGPDHFI